MNKEVTSDVKEFKVVTTSLNGGSISARIRGLSAGDMLDVELDYCFRYKKKIERITIECKGK